MDLKGTYEPWIAPARKSLGLEGYDIGFMYDEGSFGGKVRDIAINGEAEGTHTSAIIIFGKPTQVYPSAKGYVFHELSHLLHFCWMMEEKGCRQYSDLMFIFAQEPQLTVASEIAAETIAAIKGGLIKEILARKFETWRWWRSEGCFERATKIIESCHGLLKDKPLAVARDYLLHDKEFNEEITGLYQEMISTGRPHTQLFGRTK